MQKRRMSLTRRYHHSGLKRRHLNKPYLGRQQPLRIQLRINIIRPIILLLIGLYIRQVNHMNIKVRTSIQESILYTDLVNLFKPIQVIPLHSSCLDIICRQ